MDNNHAYVGFSDATGCASDFQAGAQFDLHQLDELHVRAVRQATLGFTEQDISQNRVDGPTCLAAVNLATPTQSENSLFDYYPDEYHQTGPNPTDWDVTGGVGAWFTGYLANHGFVLRGFDETLNPDSNDAWCESTLSNFTLKLIVEVDPAPAPPPPPKPKVADLLVKSIEVHDRTGAPGCISGSLGGNLVTALVRNNGDAAAVTDLDALLRVDDQPAMTLAALAIGPASEELEIFDNITFTPGLHHVNVLLDPECRVTESSDDNNSKTIDVTCAQGADAPVKPTGIDLRIAMLEVQTPDGKTGCLVGQNSVGVKIANVGDKDPGVFSAQLKVDNQVKGTTSDGGVAPGSDKQAFFSGVQFSKGSHTVEVTLDPDKQIAETNEGNNSSSIQVTCT